MASVCMPQSNYQQQQYQIMLLQHQQNQQNQQQQQHHHQQQQQQTTQYHAKHQQQRIAPTPAKVLGNSNLQNIQTMAPGPSNFGPMLAKKKYTYVNMPYGEQLPSVARRNARERNRVKQVNNGFANLRQHLPQTVINALSNGGRGASKKLSKVDTLRIAVEYIRGLQDLLDEPHTSSSHMNAHLLDESSNDEGSNYENTSYGSSENDDGRQGKLHAHSYLSEASASPTPSYCESDISIGGAAQYIQPLKLEEDMQFKFEAFDRYDDQPDDEELLDYISSWQEQ